MSTLSQIRQRLVPMYRSNTQSTCRRQASTHNSSSSSSTSSKANELTQKAASLANQLGTKLPHLSEKLGKRLNGLLGSYSEPLSHNYQFAKEVLKQVYIKENLAPPKIHQIRSSYQEIMGNASSLTFWKQSLESGDWKRLAVYAVEAVGLFSIGEMIGRRHIVEHILLFLSGKLRNQADDFETKTGRLQA
ncbi:uncharacterized protein VP01_3123g3 [Puccinia sorghi]|uniref:Uncharacterized protein n=1 Tax=Puccinia sorghi TaxID=27349 RepID=A0A0L6V024_9BASI|nr:uncharacterized protein VP01_3123g3 [Puccinia sorghi]